MTHSKDVRGIFARAKPGRQHRRFKDAALPSPALVFEVVHLLLSHSCLKPVSIMTIETSVLTLSLLIYQKQGFLQIQGGV